MTPDQRETDAEVDRMLMADVRFGIAEVPEDGGAYWTAVEAQYRREIERLKRERQLHVQCIASLQGKACALEGELSNLNHYCQGLASKLAMRQSNPVQWLLGVIFVLAAFAAVGWGLWLGAR